MADFNLDYTGLQVNTAVGKALAPDYNDLSNKPTIPSKTTDLTNDSGFITKEADDLTNYTKTSSLATVATSGSYKDLSNKPTIPSGKLNEEAYGSSDRVLGNAVILTTATKLIKYNKGSSEFTPSYVGKANAVDETTMLNYLKTTWDSAITEFKSGTVVMVLNNITSVVDSLSLDVYAIHKVSLQSTYYFQKLAITIPCASSIASMGDINPYSLGYIFKTLDNHVVLVVQDIEAPVSGTTIDITDDLSLAYGFLLIK